MRIQAPQKIAKPAAAAKKKSSAGGSDFAASLSAPTENSNVAAAQAPMPLAAIDSLLAAQSVDPDAERRAGVQSAHDVLAALEQVRRGILLGAISVGRLKAVSGSLSERLAMTTDPQLKDIMTDIVLRARVELAKAGVYS